MQALVEFARQHWPGALLAAVIVAALAWLLLRLWVAIVTAD